jgi:hypothetical protein
MSTTYKKPFLIVKVYKSGFILIEIIKVKHEQGSSIEPLKSWRVK